MASELRALRDSLADATPPPSAPSAPSTTRWRTIVALSFAVGAALGLVFAPARRECEDQGDDPLFQPFAA